MRSAIDKLSGKNMVFSDMYDATLPKEMCSSILIYFRGVFIVLAVINTAHTLHRQPEEKRCDDPAEKVFIKCVATYAGRILKRVRLWRVPYTLTLLQIIEPERRKHSLCIIFDLIKKPRILQRSFH